jgi:hypothetical protein
LVINSNRLFRITSPDKKDFLSVSLVILGRIGNIKRILGEGGEGKDSEQGEYAEETGEKPTLRDNHGRKLGNNGYIHLTAMLLFKVWLLLKSRRKRFPLLHPDLSGVIHELAQYGVHRHFPTYRHTT